MLKMFLGVFFFLTHTNNTASLGWDYTYVTLTSLLHKVCLWERKYLKISIDVWVTKKWGRMFWDLLETTARSALNHTFSSEIKFFFLTKNVFLLGFKCVVEKWSKSFRIGCWESGWVNKIFQKKGIFLSWKDVSIILKILVKDSGKIPVKREKFRFVWAVWFETSFSRNSHSRTRPKNLPFFLKIICNRNLHCLKDISIKFHLRILSRKLWGGRMSVLVNFPKLISISPPPPPTKHFSCKYSYTLNQQDISNYLV